MMMYEEERLTEEHFKIAEENGIHRKLVMNRWYRGCDIEYCITVPKRTGTGVWPEWKETALANGISEETFYSRVRRGLTPKEAATQPLNFNKSKIPKWVFEKAKENGIPVVNLSGRIHNYHWDLERACTEPIGKRGGYRKK